MLRFILTTSLLFSVSTAYTKPLIDDLEKAALIGVSMMVCDTNSGTGSGGWNHFIAEGADKMQISHDAAQEVVEARQREILTFLNKNHKLDEFCKNARAGRL